MCIRDSIKAALISAEIANTKPANVVKIALTKSHPIKALKIVKVTDNTVRTNMPLLFFTLTPPSVALYALSVCMIKWAARPFMQTDSAYSVDLHGFVMVFSRPY